MKIGLRSSLGCFALLLSLASLSAPAQFPLAPATSGPGSASIVPQTQLIQPEALVRLLQGPAKNKPLILQVGSRIMYAEAHIPGSEYTGPGSRAEGVQALESRVSSLPRHTFIVLYCGCCPWDRCPNVAPAFSKLRQMGFTNVKVLYIADNFGANWLNKGYPVEKGR